MNGQAWRDFLPELNWIAGKGFGVIPGAEKRHGAGIGAGGVGPGGAVAVFDPARLRRLPPVSAPLPPALQPGKGGEQRALKSQKTARAAGQTPQAQSKAGIDCVNFNQRQEFDFLPLGGNPNDRGRQAVPPE